MASREAVSGARARFPAWLAAVAALALLAGCGGGPSKRENVQPPAELQKLSPEIELQRVWSRSVGKGERRKGLRQRPAVGAGRLYFGTARGEVIALDAETGREVWKQRFDGLRFGGSPAYGESTLVVPTLDGLVLALNPDNGQERWRSRVSSEVIAAPAVGRGLAVVRANDGRTFAFSITSGERRWVYDRSLPTLSLRGNSAPLIVDTAVFLGYDDGSVVALRLDAGTPVWEQAVGTGEGRTDLDRMSDVDGELAFDQGMLYAVSYRGQAVALEAPSARPVWNREMSAYGGISLAGEQLLAADARGVVWALDRRTGSALWRNEDLGYRWLTTPVVHSGHVVVGDLDGHIHWLDASDGRKLARQRLGKRPIRATPVVVGDLLVVTTTWGDVAAYRLRR